MRSGFYIVRMLKGGHMKKVIPEIKIEVKGGVANIIKKDKGVRLIVNDKDAGEETIYNHLYEVFEK